MERMGTRNEFPLTSGESFCPSDPSALHSARSGCVLAYGEREAKVGGRVPPPLKAGHAKSEPSGRDSLMILVGYRKSSKYSPGVGQDRRNMTTKTTKAVTVGALAAALAIMLAYSALILPASAQAPTTTTTTTSTGSSTATPSASSTTGSTSAPPGPVCKQGVGPGWMVVQGRGGPMGGPFGFSTQAQANLTVGQTITITSSRGEYVAIANPDDNGTASGTITFTVTGKLAGGYTLSITSGSITVNGTTYTISSGSAQMDTSASHLEGQGTTTTSSGAFLVTATAHGTFAGTTATMSLDLTNGSTEYRIALSGTT